jgi:hypothetical protein
MFLLGTGSESITGRMIAVEGGYSTTRISLFIP